MTNKEQLEALLMTYVADGLLETVGVTEDGQIQYQATPKFHEQNAVNALADLLEGQNQ